MSEHKVALVTGSSQKLGAAIVEMLARNGYDVAINYSASGTKAEVLAEKLRGYGVRAETFQASLSSSAGCVKLVSEVEEKFGRLDLLVNNYGPWTGEPIAQLPEEQYDKVMDGNVKTTYLMSKLAKPMLEKSGKGKIINISSCAAFVLDETIYGVAKNAVKMLTSTMACEFSPSIQVNAVAPGLINGPDVDADFAELEKSKNLTKILPQYADIASLIEVMISDAFRFVNGHTLVADGGKSLPLSCVR